MTSKEKLYSNLAWIWPIMSPPEDYIEEADHFITLVDKYAQIPVTTVLNLGCGGGHIDMTLKKRFKITGVDKSEAMLELARKLNPEANYIAGDMRTARLGRLFDAVVVHDAISYMLTQEDLMEVFKTAYAHLKPGGLFITVVEETPEHFQQNRVAAYTRSRDQVEITSIEHFYDPNRNDSIYDYTLIYLIRQNGDLQVEVDYHTCGVFPLFLWKDLMQQAGFAHIQSNSFCSHDEPGEGYGIMLGFRSGSNINFG